MNSDDSLPQVTNLPETKPILKSVCCNTFPKVFYPLLFSLGSKFIKRENMCSILVEIVLLFVFSFLRQKRVWNKLCFVDLYPKIVYDLTYTLESYT
jgi:hypothetical protein